MLKSKNRIETNKYELEIEVSAEQFEEAVQNAYLKAKANITVPGFRKGKAPRKIIERTYGEGVFYDDAINAIYPSVLQEAVDAAELVLVTRPEVEITAVSKEAGVTMKAVCITKPVVNVSDYKGIKVTRNVDTVTDEMIDAEIEKLRKKGERIIDVDDRAAQNGDDVVIDFEGFCDGVAFDGGKAEKFTLTLGSGQFIPGYEEQIVGHNIGDEFDVNVTFPEKYHVAELAGKPAVFKVKLHEIKAKELPAVDDDFVKDTTDFNTVDELKADIRTKLEESANKKADAEVEGKIFDAVIEKIEGEIPEVMYDNRVNEMVEDFSHRLASQGMNIDIYLQYMGMDMDGLKKTYREQAEKQVKLRLALEKITELEGITVSDEEADAEMAKIAEQYKMPVEEVKKYIRVDDLMKDVAVGKAVELIKSNAKITKPRAAKAKAAEDKNKE